MWTTPHDKLSRIPYWNVGVVMIPYSRLTPNGLSHTWALSSFHAGFSQPSPEDLCRFHGLYLWNFQPSNYSKCRNKIPTGMETQVFDEGLLQVPSKDLCAMQIYSMPQHQSILRFLFPISPGSASSVLVEWPFTIYGCLQGMYLPTLTRTAP